MKKYEQTHHKDVRAFILFIDTKIRSALKHMSVGHPNHRKWNYGALVNDLGDEWLIVNRCIAYDASSLAPASDPTLALLHFFLHETEPNDQHDRARSLSVS